MNCSILIAVKGINSINNAYMDFKEHRVRSKPLGMPCDGCKRKMNKTERFYTVGPVNDPFTVCRSCYDEYENQRG